MENFLCKNIKLAIILLTQIKVNLTTTLNFELVIILTNPPLHPTRPKNLLRIILISVHFPTVWPLKRRPNEKKEEEGENSFLGKYSWIVIGFG
jgi:hypothetical protein